MHIYAHGAGTHQARRGNKERKERQTEQIGFRQRGAMRRGDVAAARSAVSTGPGFVTGGRKRSHPLITQLKWTGNSAGRGSGRCHPARHVDSVTIIVVITTTTGVTVSREDTLHLSSMEFILNDPFHWLVYVSNGEIPYESDPDWSFIFFSFSTAFFLKRRLWRCHRVERKSMEFIKSSLVLASFERQNSKRSIRTDLFIFFIAFFLNVIFLSLLLSHKRTASFVRGIHIKWSLLLASFERRNSKRSIRTGDLFIFFAAFFFKCYIFVFATITQRGHRHLSSVEFILNGPFYWPVSNDEIFKQSIRIGRLFSFFKYRYYYVITKNVTVTESKHAEFLVHEDFTKSLVSKFQTIDSRVLLNSPKKKNRNNNYKRDEFRANDRRGKRLWISDLERRTCPPTRVW